MLSIATIENSARKHRSRGSFRSGSCKYPRNCTSIELVPTQLTKPAESMRKRRREGADQTFEEEISIAEHRALQIELIKACGYHSYRLGLERRAICMPGCAISASATIVREQQLTSRRQDLQTHRGPRAAFLSFGQMSDCPRGAASTECDSKERDIAVAGPRRCRTGAAKWSHRLKLSVPERWRTRSSCRLWEGVFVSNSLGVSVCADKLFCSMNRCLTA